MWKTASLVLICLATGCSQQSQENHKGTPPRQETTTVAEHPRPVPAFNGERAFALLKRQTDFGPRNPNSSGHAACRAYLLETLRPLADDVRPQDFSTDGYKGERLSLTNIIASFRPALTSRILLCAHWDTRPRAERDERPQLRNTPILGANDGASGVAVLLELAAILRETPPSIGVDIVLFDGEDYGMESDHGMYLIGSRYFAKNKPPDYIPRFGILLDMVGDASLDLPKELHSVRYAPDVVSLVWDTARELGVHQFLDEPGEEILDDHVPLNEAGIKTIDIIDFNYPDPSHRYWHTHQDIPENCSAESLEAVGTVLTHVVYKQKP